MKKPRHILIPNDWPFLERIINEIDLTISEAKSEVVSTVLILESEMSAVQNFQASAISALSALSAGIVGLGGITGSLASAHSQTQSRVLVLESEVSQALIPDPLYVAVYGCMLYTSYWDETYEPAYGSLVLAA